MNVTPPAAESLEQKRLRLAALLQKKAAAPKTYPTTFNQQRLWFLDQLAPGGTGYNLNFVLRVRGPFDAVAMSRALHDVVARHESLRTSIRAVGGMPVQVVEPQVSLDVPVESLEHLEGDALEAAVQERTKAFVREPFDLARAPLLRVRLWRETPESHVLCLAVHHVVSDGWSLGIFMKELKEAYAAFRNGRPPEIEAPALQYSDFARWQREHLSGAELTRQLEFWKEWMDGAPGLLDLQTDRPRPSTQDFEGGMHQEEFGEEFSDEVRAFARREGVTPFMVLLSVFAALMTRWTGQEDVVVGTPIAGRARPELEGVFGYFANTLALRTDVSGDPTFRELLGRVRPMLLGAYAHQDLPFERLVDELQIERSLSHNPLFQVVFAHQNIKNEGIGLEGVEIESIDTDVGTTTFDLTFQVGEGKGEYAAVVEYKTGLFDEATIERMVTHYRRALAAVVADPNVRVSALPLMDTDDEAAVLAQAMGPAVAVDPALTLHGMIERQAAATPDAPALVDETSTLTYAQLDARANRLAHRLRALGVGAETRVALAFERSHEMVIGLLATLKAGGAYLPIDPRYPADRKAYLLEDSGAAVLISHGDAAEGFPPHGAKVLVIDADPCREEPETAAAPLAGPENLAYVIYTSGSTGRPKGVGIPHRAVVNLMHASDRWMPMRPGDRTLAFASPAFDASVLEFCVTLAYGAALHIAEQESLLPGGPLEAVLRERAITRSFLPPSTLAVLREGDFPALRYIMCGGEALSAEAIARWGAGRSVVNGYGPTETTVCCSVAPGETGDRRPPIGKPVANVRSYVLDARLCPVPTGVPGEICIGGAGVARGYLGRPGLTAERFVPDPYAGVPGARMYRSGDKARWLADGNMDFLGRLDEQVKVRGYRIELGEIEAVLRQHPAVGDAVVILREDVPGDKRIVAYVAPQTGGEKPSPAELRALALERMPEYMAPSAILVLDALPQTAHGKVDRRALPAPSAAEGPVSAEHVAPRTETEARLVEIWREVLNVGRVGVTDSFFALGGHSLLATQIVARVAAEMKVDIPIRTIFEDPTVAAMAARCDAQASAPAAEVAPRAGITRVSRQARTVDLSTLEE